jgi:hypothetical protein
MIEASMYQVTPSPRELIITVKPEVGLKVNGEALSSTTDFSTQSLRTVLESNGARLKPAFGISEEPVRLRMSNRLKMEIDPSLFYRVIADDQRLEEIAAKLLDLEEVDSAFIKPGTELPLIDLMDEPSSTTLTLNDCNFTSLQGYRGPAPGGIDSEYAETLKGGKGGNVKIIDIEKGWCFSHVDLVQNLGGLIGGVASTEAMARHHGTAVLGVLGGDVNDFGVTGICPDANVSTVSILGAGSDGRTSDWGTAAAIRLAADKLCAGDIIVIELQTPGPVSNFEVTDDTNGYIPVEWWPDNLLAIKYATDLDIVVVEAGGNGASNLSDLIYDQPKPVFPASWRNPFRRESIDSGAIIVGAGAPPLSLSEPGSAPDRSRVASSNYGYLFDAQGWGQRVTTCGFGDLNCGADEELKYTKAFGGTSSATPIVAGALACVQGVLKAAGKDPLTPFAARDLLRTTGSDQTDGPAGPNTQRIGNRPDIRQMLNTLGVP